MRRIYLHQRPDWPRLQWKAEVLIDRLAAVRHRQGQLLGRMDTLGFDLSREAVLNTLTEEAVKTSEIEGEILCPDQVRSSVALRLGLEAAGLPHPDRAVEGIVELMLDATQGYDQPLTGDRLFAWHAGLFPTGYSGLRRITAGGWRDEPSDPMQVVSGPMGRQMVHFEAPPAARVEREMQEFLDWFNAPSETDGVVRAGIAHLWFVTIHPFEDGNGRLARAITDMALCRADKSPQRFYSMSAQIRRERADYYRVLERTQRGSTDVTRWLDWFLACLDRAMESSEESLAAALAKGRFWQQVAHIPVNERQRAMLNRLLNGFEGNLTTSKWARIMKCSQDTALRDIRDLMDHGVLERNPQGGRSTSYLLVTGFAGGPAEPWGGYWGETRDGGSPRPRPGMFR